MKNIFISSIVLLCSFAAFGQQASEDLGLIANVEHSSITLRWMPLNAATFQKGNQLGYQLYRQTIVAKTKEPIGARKRLGFFKPIAPADFESLGKTNRYAEVARKIINQEASTDAEANDFNFALAMLMSSTSEPLTIAMGFLMTDKEVKPNESYIYTIELADASIKASTTVNSSVYSTLLSPLDLDAYFSDSVVTVRWQPGDSLLNVAYKVERSDDAGKTWKSLDENPLLITAEPDSLGRTYGSKEDKIPTFYKDYYYRVFAYTPFGKLSIPSKRVKIQGYRQRFPRLEPRYEVKAKGLDYTWLLADSLQAESKGFKVYTSRFVDSAYTLLATLPPSARLFHDANAANDTYLKVSLIDWVGKEQFSEPQLISYLDSIPPANAPILVKRVNEKGLVTLAWKANTERDFQGYSVYRADNPKAEFSLMSRTLGRDTVFTDTLALNLLNKKLYYVVRSFDSRMNGSLPSDTIIIKRPDIIPPASAAFTAFDVADTGVALSWANSPSDDVALTLLLRKPITDSAYCVLEVFAAKDSVVAFTDTTGIEKQEYHYQLVPIDDSGLAGDPAQIQLAKLYTGIRSAIEPLQFSYELKTKTIKIKWPAPSRKVKKYILYRKAPEDASMAVYTYFEGKHKNFEDQNLKLNKTYIYRIMAIYEDDSESKLSEEFEAMIEQY
jgi:uncharacterized protein